MRLLGITRLAVARLRSSGRLPGHRTKRRKSDGVGGKWWSYRKDNVHALLADSDYLRRSRAAKAGRAQAEPEPYEPEKFAAEAEACLEAGRPLLACCATLNRAS